ncbi:MAG TPA: malto-oligosyltrehalose trehalohydrolase [Actinomycetota bacterium]|nr:malto-oligosyltrehalose trehalohydrolase [Actinomycetota bacterium]
MDEVTLSPSTELGAVPQADGRTRFEAWAPNADTLTLSLSTGAEVRMERRDRGYFEAFADAPAGTRYRYRFPNGDELADPASRSQPEDVLGPSEVVDTRSFAWTDAEWHGIALGDSVTYELHVGTFTPEGTFDAAVERLDELADLGVTAVEPMPIAEFPGGRNWGYDGVFPFAPESSYGGPFGFQRFVDAAHARGLAVVLDVVYNHLGPQGNVLPRYGPYFSRRFGTPWGDALNLDGVGGDEVRRYIGENALRWFEEFHVDALRLDAVHGIVDPTARPILGLLARASDELSERLGRSLLLIAESGLNDSRMIRARREGGLGLHAQWADELHHAIHVVLTGERDGYYADYGRVAQIATAYRSGYVHTGEWSEHLQRRWGNDTTGVPSERFVVFTQNHDQVGNRATGDRLAELAGLDGQKVAAGLVLLSPFPPLLFQGEEYGETNPFLYFVSHGDPELIEAVRSGRRAEFERLDRADEPPDPAAEDTFERSRLDRGKLGRAEHAGVRELYRELLRLRREEPALANTDRGDLDVATDEATKTLVLARSSAEERAVAIFNLAGGDGEVHVEGASRTLGRVLDSSEERFGGPGARSPGELLAGRVTDVGLRPRSFALYTGRAA